MSVDEVGELLVEVAFLKKLWNRLNVGILHVATPWFEIILILSVFRY